MQVATNTQFDTLAQFLPVMNHSCARGPEATAQRGTLVCSILIMEGNVSLARLLATGLSAESMDVDVTHDPDSAMRKIEALAYDLLILDLDVPDMDGLLLLRMLREKRPDMRVLVLSGRTGVEGLVDALDQGADDYLMKPFSLLEMMARVRALRRRSGGSTQKALPPSRNLLLHRDQCRVERGGRTIDLTPREFALLEFMMQNAGKPLTRSMLTQEVWNMSVETNTNIVDVYIKYLRDKLDGDFEDKLIRTVRGVGYVFQEAGATP